MDLNTFFDTEFDEHVAVAAETKNQLRPTFTKLVNAARSSIERGGKILFFGNY